MFESTARELHELLSQRQPVLLSSHIHPDPDAIGSLLGCRLILEAMGIGSTAILQDAVPFRCRKLPGAELVKTFAPDANGRSFSSAVILDCGSLSRIGDVASLITADAVVINIDHHVSNDQFGILNIVDPSCSATAEILFHICRTLNISLTPPLSDCLYAGVLADTGRFRHGIESGRVLSVAAQLADAGAAVSQITNDLYFDLPASDILSIGAIYSTLELFANGLICTLFVRREHLIEDPDSVVDSALSIRGVEVAAMLSEAPDGKIRVSLRSRESVNVSRIAELLGGGGHERAAGFRMKGTLESVRDRLLPLLEDSLASAIFRRSAAPG